ncbi:hypothetical protein K3G63_11230 [Hymenobacter sp. HSC-4F20]|uniref:hypothetical protein n=1 Tax=Hymenobacter sp. HSC-4F20 TaxID=2864135 RepID=UPI001C73918E|nr:hypothetical protein [Hymenobacter sp. HSC-4F20]MBX0291016.1 hypothetical protein [Hymenobacter sp. HSC-4F20]
MNKRTLALEYFIRLIEHHELVNRREAFHRTYSKPNIPPKNPFSQEHRLVVHKYDAEREIAVYEHKGFGSPEGRYESEFGREICDEVADELLAVKALVLEQLSSSEQLKRDVFYSHVMTDIERLTSVLAEEEVFARYSCIAAALLEIKDLVLRCAPQQTEKGSDDKPIPAETQATGFHYRCFKEGSLQEDKSLTRSHLGNLFYGLRDTLELIEPTTPLADFRAIFSGKPVKKRVVWMGSINQLWHFVNSIEPKLTPPGHKKLTGKWVKAAACFTKSDGEDIAPQQLQYPGVKATGVHMGREIQEVATLLK